MELYDKVALLEEDSDDAGPGAPLLFSNIEIDDSEIPNRDPDDDQTRFDAYRSENPIGAARKLFESFVTKSLEWTEQYRRAVSFNSICFSILVLSLRFSRLSSFRLVSSLILK